MEELIYQIESGIKVAGVIIDVLGVIVIVVGILLAFYRFVHKNRAHPEIDHYRPFKMRIGRALLLGLEVLVAADIIKTVALEATFSSLGILAGLVLIRTFLGWTLTLEIEGRWPWQPKTEDAIMDLTQ